MDLLSWLPLVALIVEIFDHFYLVELNQHFQFELVHISLLLEYFLILDNEVLTLGFKLSP